MTTEPAAGAAPAPLAAAGAADDAALRAAKRSLRRQVLAARDALAPDARAAAAEAITRTLAALPSFAGAGTLLLTLPFGSEWDTLPLVRMALAAGKVVALPRADAATRRLALGAIGDPVADVVCDPRGIPEPAAACPPVAPAAVDWVLVPGVAFDRAGRRLGYGAGYYDRLLPLLPARTPRIVGTLALQVVDRVPTAPHDARVDAIVTEAWTLTVATG